MARQDVVLTTGMLELLQALGNACVNRSPVGDWHLTRGGETVCGVVAEHLGVDSERVSVRLLNELIGLAAVSAPADPADGEPIRVVP